MAGNISEERTELQEDDEKFQTILHEFGSEWGYETSDEDVDDDDHLLIDLDYDELSDSEQNEVVRSFSKSDSLTPSYYGSGSQSLSYTAADEENGEVVPRPNLELPSQVNVAQYKADPLKTLHLNRALQGILEEHISNIKTALKGNKEKQDKLEDDASDSTSKAEKKGMYVGVFRAPYFRDGNSYPPANEDVIQKKITGDYDIVTLDSMKDLRQFNKTAKLLLREAVFEDCMEKALKPIVAKMEAEIEKRDKCIEDYETMSSKLDSEKHHMNELRKCPSNAETDELIEEVECTVEELKDSLFEKSQVIKTHKDEIARLEQMIKTNRNTPVEQLLATVDSEKVDWMKIAKSHFSGHSTWVDCQKAWENLVSPRLNTRPWTKDEEKKLLDLVKKSTTNDWKQVASDLGTARTAFQCFSHYQQKFNSDLKPRPWSSEEDATLVRITNNVKDSVGFYNWSKVSTLMDSRSPIECMYRFTKVDPSQSRGRFTMVEDAKLLAAVKMIGPCWSKIAKFIGTRNMVQCRDRYLNCLAPNINFSHFTYDEDVKLLKLRKNFGQCWAKMVPEFIGRTDSMLLNRYRQLQRWQRQSDWFERQTDATKRMLLGKSLTVTERHHFRARAEDYLKFQLGVFTEDYKRQELDRLNHVDPDIIPPRPPRHLRCYSFGASRRGCNLNKWSERLNVHMKLTENLHKLLKKEIINTAAENKREGLPAVSEELREEIMHKTVEETLKENKGRIPSKFNAKQQVKKLEAALNKAFLTSGNISVQELMRLSALQKKRTKTVEKNTMVDSELKNLLRRRGRTMTKQGRTRQFFDKDTRPRKVIEEELDECDQSVPVMLMKCLGTDANSLCTSVRHRCLDYQEELSKQPSYDEDADFQREEAETQKTIAELEVRQPGMLYPSMKLKKLRKKLKTLRKIYREKVHLNNKIVENKISTCDDDREYLETLTDENKEVNKNLSLMACNPPGLAETTFDAEMIEASSQTRASNFSSSVPTSNVQITLSGTSLTQSQPSHQTTAGESTASAPKSDHEFAVPLAPPIKQRKRRSSRILTGKFPDEPAKKVFKALSKKEIMTERSKLPSSKKKIFTNLPLLPPSLSTLLGLRALFLMKNDLKDKTQQLHKPEQHNTTNPHSISIEFELPRVEDQPAPVVEDESLVEDTASWFLYTNPELLCEQASKFKPYGRPGMVGNIRSKHHFKTIDKDVLHSAQLKNEPDQAAFETGTLVYPLEERGGHLPNFTNKSVHDCDDDDGGAVKPAERKLKTNTAKKNKVKKPSHYEVVMGFTGCAENDRISVKSIKKQLSKSQSSDSGNPPSTHKNISLIPATVIKREPGAATVSYNICHEYYSDDDRLHASADSSSRDSVPDSSTTTPDPACSAQALNRSERNVAADDDDEDDVVAVIHLDDDANLTPTVINISSSKTETMKKEIVEGKDEDSVIFTENDRPSQFMAIPPEHETAETTKELSSLELPENRINSILSNRRLKNYKSRIVLVGVDEESKRIVHFKSEDNKFTAYEAIPTTVAEANVGRHRGVQGDDSSKQEILDIPECMRTLRRTDEYKLLLARFRALFMWPVFMSTVKPSPLYDPSLPTSLRYVNPDMAQQPVRNRRGRRCKGKLSIAKREHLKTLHARSLAARAKKRASKENAAGQGNGVGSMDIDVGAGVSVEQQTAVPESDAVVSSEQQTTLSTPAESSERSDTNNMASAGDGENLSESNAGNENVTERKRRRRTVRPKGSTTNKYELVLRERSTRIKKNVLKNAPPPEPAKEAIKQLPQWWKDAVLAYMLAKKAIANGQEENEEVRIDEDDEFFDKGNYSDDEWYQQLREEELKISKQQGHNEIVKQDAEALASQDNGAEDIVLFFNPDMVALTSQDTVAQDIVLLGNQDDVSLTSQDTVANDIVSLGNQDVVALASQDTVAQDIVLLEK
ncbi:hypothetical protein BsWGS_23430 [Bradybaena similaris]